MKASCLSASTTCLPPKSVFSSEIAAYRSKGIKNRFGLRSWDTAGTSLRWLEVCRSDIGDGLIVANSSSPLEEVYITVVQTQNA